MRGLIAYGLIVASSVAASKAGADNVCGPPPEPFNTTAGASNMLIIGDSISMGCCWGSSTTEPIGYGLYVKNLFESEGLATVQVRELAASLLQPGIAHESSLKSSPYAHLADDFDVFLL
jgi:hypothetical protein